MVKLEKAAFGAGCFWGVEETFRQLDGVTSTRVGYMGGGTKNPTYEQVCTDSTGHAETVEVSFNPEKISFEKLLETFWESHDPTQVNRQGPDEGTQYRSVIFYYNAGQKAAAEKSLSKHQRQLKEKIATKIEPAKEFWPAEEYHQKYLSKRGLNVCH